jgi:hypothetical protein
MPTLRELQEQRETLVAAARERLNQINANTDESRAAELETQHDAAMAELDTLDANIAAKSASPRRAVAERAPRARACCATGARRPGRRHRRRRRAGGRRIPRGVRTPISAPRARSRCSATSSARSCSAATRRSRPSSARRRPPMPPAATRPVELQARSSGDEEVRSDVRPGRHARDRHQRRLFDAVPDGRRHGQHGAATTQGTTLLDDGRATSCSARSRSAPSRSRRRGFACRRSSPTIQPVRDGIAARQPARRAPRPPGEQPADDRRRHDRAAGHRGRRRASARPRL